MIPRTLEEAGETSWLPEPSCRPDGFEALLFHRGKWRHMRWSEDHEAWSLGYGKGFVVDTSDRAYAPLPPKPEGADGFYDWKD